MSTNSGKITICGIYKITSPTSRIYIGQSINICNRFLGYKNLKCKSQVLLYNSFIKHGVDSHKFEIIHHCAPSKLNELEKSYIMMYNCFNTKYGLNLKDGGYNGSLSIGSRKMISLSLKGRKRSLESIEKFKNTIKEIGVWNKGMKYQKTPLKKELHRGGLMIIIN